MQRYFAKDIINNQVILTKDDEHHIKNVMRMEKNDQIEVVYDKHLFLACINSIQDMDIKVIEELQVPKVNSPYIILIVPCLKEQKMDFIFQKGTELGINEFIVAPFERSMVKYDERKEKNKLERWQKICKEASEQSMRVDIPIITIENNWNFVGSLNALKLVCSTTEQNNSLKRVLKKDNDYDKIALVIGPEGGISPLEEDKLVNLGFQKITLGQQIMRVETVPLFLASTIKYEYME